jgi:nucleoside-diphosphate-sugar epimerase
VSPARQWSVTELRQRVDPHAAGEPAWTAWVPTWSPQARPPLVLPETWVITGATGGFGRHLARALLRTQPALRLLLPVRAANLAEATARVGAALCPTSALRAEAQRHGWAGRITPWVLADLDQWSPGSTPVGSVIHSAADLSLALSAEALWPSNVALTERLVRFAHRVHARRFDHISTLSVWVAGDTPAGVCQETDALTRAGTLHGGYAATKWASEWALPMWTDGLPTALHRLGLLVGSPEEPLGLAGDPMAATARAWARWGKPPFAGPAPATVAFDWTPIETAAAAVAHVALGQGTGVFQWAATEPVSGERWVHALTQRYGATPGEWPATDPVGKAARRAWGRWVQPDRQGWWMDLFQSSRHRYSGVRGQAHGVAPWSPTSADLVAGLSPPLRVPIVGNRTGAYNERTGPVGPLRF